MKEDLQVLRHGNRDEAGIVRRETLGGGSADGDCANDCSREKSDSLIAKGVHTSRKERRINK
jgi:hypothetical protein